jgi:hypothetical protein
MLPMIKPSFLTQFSKIKAIALGIVLVGTVAFLAIHFDNVPQQRTNAGFGPDWECTGVGKGDPICVKKPLSK